VTDQRVWTAEEVRALGVRTTVPIAGEIIAGLCKDESYRLVGRGEFPVPVIKVGKNKLVVPVAPILRLLGIDPADTATPELSPPAGGSRLHAVAADTSAEDINAA
jgi:hypothetical protein